MIRGVTVGDRLRAERRRRFVGRRSELELFAEALAAPEPPFSVLFVHGPGGVGKTALLAAIADHCEDEGIAATRLDVRTIEPSPPAFRRALEEALSLPAGADPAGSLGSQRQVLLLDTYESAGSIDPWLRERFLPALPADTIVVIAGRKPPTREWHADAGWNRLLRVVSLRNLDPADAREYLSLAGVPEELHDRILTLTHGHPLALALLVEVLAQRGASAELPTGLMDAPDAVAALLERFVDDVPSPLHRRALVACAHARYTTEELLRAVFGEEGPALFEWLRDLSFVEEGKGGVFPHDVAREALSADARWRDRESFNELHHAVRAHVLQRIERCGGRDQEPIGEFHFLHRTNPFAAAYWDWDVSRDAYNDRLRSGDAEAILAMTDRHEGAAAAEVAAHWLERYPEGFVVFRRAEEAIGYGLFLDLERIGPDDIAKDPGASVTADYIARLGPPRADENILLCRSFIDRDQHQGPSASFDLIPVAHLQRIFGEPRRGVHLISGWTQEEPFAPLMSYIDFHRAPEADFRVGDVSYFAFAHDWRQRPLEPWLDLMAEREVAPGWDQPASGAPAPVLALSQPEFVAAVKEALKNLHRDGALAANPLLRSRALRERAGESAGPDELRDLIEAAAGTLRADPRDEKLERALTRTYLRPAPTQEAAAELLGLPFSTYRRHLRRAIDRVAELLWSWELYGRD